MFSESQETGICHDNLWMYLMAQTPNLSFFFFPFHGWFLQAVTPSISSQNALWGLWRMSWPFLGHISTHCCGFLFLWFSSPPISSKNRKDRLDYTRGFLWANLGLVQVQVEERKESHSALLGWCRRPLMVWPNTDSKQLTCLCCVLVRLVVWILAFGSEIASLTD